VAGKILKFAADAKIYHTVYSGEDVSALQSDLCNLVEWSKELQMLTMESYSIWDLIISKLNINDVQLECASEEKVLGVIISGNLK